MQKHDSGVEVAQNLNNNNLKGRTFIDLINENNTIIDLSAANYNKFD